jgi:polyisoprenoid-binding protein YceI
MPVTRLYKAAYILLVSLPLLSSCASRPDISSQQTSPSNFPDSLYTEASNNRLNNVYKVDKRASEILITVRRGGLMASLGHDHIVASHDLQGYILVNSDSAQNLACRADFYAPIAKLDVDNAELRAKANLLSSPSAKDIAATTSNMFKSIEAVDFPFASLHSSDCLTALSGEKTEVILTIHGIEQKRHIAINVEQAENKIILSGRFSILQSDFGIEPFSIMNGLIKVEDKLQLAFKIITRKLD